MKSKSANPREEGMALLFALGFLAMLLILGLGFVTTSLLSQKLAANNATRAQSRMLARSAAARAAMYIMLYNDQSIVNEITLDDYSSVASYDEVSYNDNGSKTSGAVNDQLVKGSGANAAESKLNYKLVSKDDASENFFSSGQSFGAKWIYFYDSPSGTEGRKIVGRAAFQVLPGLKSLSLYRVTGNKNIGNELGVKPFDFRWGRDTDELRLDNTRTLPNWSTDGLAGSSTNAPYTYDGLYTAYSDFFPSESTADLEATAKKKKWIEYWFTEGKSPISREVYSALDGSRVRYYHRFNIGDYYTDGTERSAAATDNWYDRFKTPRGGGWSDYSRKNTDDALNDLASGGVEARDDDADDAQLDIFGLPFLKRIGNDKHSFEYLQTLRRQIAANLNDYCDNDSIPTSDKAATSWDVANAGTYPTYTGNEKTLYINEVALQIVDQSDPSNPITVNCDAQGGLAISAFKVKLLLELIRMYDKQTGADNLLDPGKLEAKLKLDRLYLKFAFYEEFTGKVRYTKNGENLEETFTGNLNSGYSDDDYAAIVNYSPTGAITIGSFSNAEPDNGYSIGSADLTGLTIQQPTSKFTDGIRAAAEAAVPTGGTYSSYTLTDVKVGCKVVDGESKISFAAILLKPKAAVSETIGGKSITACPADCGVDFVRFSTVGEMSIKSAIVKTLSSITPGGSLTLSDKGYFVGGIEARDPRQNLNPSSDPENSDWNLAPELAEVGADGAKTIPSVTLNANKITGLKNRYADPHAPQYVQTDGSATACNTALIDVESATDPAWKGDSAGQHVSTAYIRNEPMVSPWELGLVHRGREWQTLNLKSAGNFGGTGNIALSDIKPTYNWTDSGTTYQKGDGAILEFVKLTPLCRTMGKIPLKSLRENVIKSASPTPEWNGVDEAYNKDIVKMLFDGIRVGQTMKQFYTETKFGAPTQQGGTAVSSDDALLTEFVSAVDSISDLKMRSQLLNTEYGYYKDGSDDLFTFDLVTKTNDALREELIGKTINLLAAEQNTPPNIFKVIVVAQTIRDVGGIDSDVTISKLHNGTATDLGCRLGRFDFISDATDWENNTYYDEITGEVKALVTIERVPADDDKNYGRMIIRKIEYID